MSKFKVWLREVCFEGEDKNKVELNIFEGDLKHIKIDKTYWLGHRNVIYVRYFKLKELEIT